MDCRLEKRKGAKKQKVYRGIIDSRHGKGERKETKVCVMTSRPMIQASMVLIVRINHERVV